MKRYKIDLSAAEFFGLIKAGQIGEDTEFEAYDVPTVQMPKAAPKKPGVRKARRTAAQIAADNAAKNGNAPVVVDADPPTKSLFPWKDAEMNKAS